MRALTAVERVAGPLRSRKRRLASRGGVPPPAAARCALETEPPPYILHLLRVYLETRPHTDFALGPRARGAGEVDGLM